MQRCTLCRDRFTHMCEYWIYSFDVNMFSHSSKMEWNEERAATSIYGNNNLSASKSTSINTISYDWSIGFEYFFRACMETNTSRNDCPCVRFEPPHIIVHVFVSLRNLFIDFLVSTWLTKSSAHRLPHHSKFWFALAQTIIVKTMHIKTRMCSAYVWH